MNYFTVKDVKLKNICTNKIIIATSFHNPFQDIESLNHAIDKYNIKDYV